MEEREKYHALISAKKDLSHAIDKKWKKNQCPQYITVANGLIQWSSHQENQTDQSDETIGEQNLYKLIVGVITRIRIFLKVVRQVIFVQLYFVISGAYAQKNIGISF